MKLAIIETGHVDVELRRYFGSYAEMFETWLRSVEPDLEFVHCDPLSGQISQLHTHCDGYVLTGSSSSVLDSDPWIVALRGFARDAHSCGRKLVGVCFGHQLLAQALGGTVQRASGGWALGTMLSEVHRRKAWMTPERAHFRLLVAHRDQVVSLPPHAECLAGNEFCRYGVVQHSENAISLQGHPEHAWQYTAALIERTRDDLPSEVYEKAMQTVKMPADSDLIARWVLKFLRHGG